VRYRVAVDRDVPAVVDLVESAYRGERSQVGWTTEAHLLDGQRTDADEVAAIVAASNKLLVLAIDRDAGVGAGAGGELVGCFVLERRDDSRAYFGSFAVRPGRQGGGIGKGLLAEAERIARDDWACGVLELTVIAQRADLIEWYARRGYVTTGETRPFPYGDPKFGLPRRDDLRFAVLEKHLPPTAGTDGRVDGVERAGG
jgi:GNAT superfamily N-acetyltransferase